MSLGWTDGNTFIPVNSTLLASSKKENILGIQKEYDGRSLAGRRRKLAQTKGPEAMLELIKKAQSAGHKADYVLFDSWFSSPSHIITIKSLGLDSIAMIKKSSKIRYEFNGELLSLQKLFGICKNAEVVVSIFFLSTLWLVRNKRFRHVSSVFVIRTRRKIGLLLSVQT